MLFFVVSFFLVAAVTSRSFVGFFTDHIIFTSEHQNWTQHSIGELSTRPRKETRKTHL